MSEYIETSKLRKGTAFMLHDKFYLVKKFTHTKKGRGLATVRVKVQDLQADAIVEKTFTSNEKVELADLSYSSAQYLYMKDENLFFMDSSDYSQFEVEKKYIEEKVHFLEEGMKVTIVRVEGIIVDVQIPKKVVLTIKSTEPGLVGDSATSPTKIAVTDTGYKLNVPIFIKNGEKIVVNTESGEYVSKQS